ncbi:endo alpha-1,4 polygalactosaminidase [Microbacterium sp. GXS0129]|uniref:endo alpha-1,4 polygalactosaminidase n=1 Tax=Microbacterium sp. GXS0129 TaxID=3377836 RepID=UPI00383B6AE6
MSALRPVITIAALGTVLLLSGCAATGSDVGDIAGAGTPWPETTTFDYQLGGPYELGPGVGIVARDRTAPPAPDAYSICYVNAFQTQPGEAGSWPSSVLLTDDEGDLVHDPDWPDEVLLDTSTPDRRAAIVAVVAPWLRGCADDGFQAVEFDNLDSFTRSAEALSLEDNIDLARMLSDVAHDAGLAVGQKNTAEHAARLRADAGFDFAVTEECAAYEECPAYRDVYGDAVLDIEYTDELPRSFAQMCADADSPTLMILRDRDLHTPDSAEYVFEACPPRG